MSDIRFSKLHKIIGTSSSDRRFIISQTGGGLFLQALYKLLNFATVWLLARFLTQKIYGEYALVMSWVPVISAISTVGIPRLMSREIARYHISQEWQQLRGFVTSSFLYVLGISAITVPILYVVIKLILPDGLALQDAFIIGVLMVVLYNLVKVIQSTLEGVKFIVLGRLPDSFIQPVIFICIIVFLQMEAYQPTSANAIGLYALITLIFSVGIGFLFVRYKLPQQVYNFPHIFPENLIKRAIPFLGLNIFNLLDTRISIFLLGWLIDTSSVAIYSVVSKSTSLLSFGLIAFSQPIVRIVLQRHLVNDKLGMQRIVSQGAKLLAFIALPLALFFIIFGKWYLHLFSEEYVMGYVPLIILVIGELINVGTGIVGNFLAQLNYERLVSKVVVLSLVINIIIGLIAIPRYGVIGAAIAESSSMVIRNISLCIIAYKKTGINTSAFS